MEFKTGLLLIAGMIAFLLFIAGISFLIARPFKMDKKTIPKQENVKRVQSSGFFKQE